MPYTIKIGNMYLFKRMSLQDSDLTRRITQATKYDGKNEAYNVVRELVTCGVDEETISVESFDYYTEYDKENEQGIPFESKKLFNLIPDRDDLDALISETIELNDSLPPLKNFIEKRYPGSLRLDAYKNIHSAFIPVYMEAFGLEEEKFETLTDADLQALYPSLSSEEQKKVNAIEAITEAMVYLQRKDRVEGMKLFNHLLGKNNNEVKK